MYFSAQTQSQPIQISQTQRKRNIFRTQIRRKTLQKIFDEKRSGMLEYHAFDIVKNILNQSNNEINNLSQILAIMQQKKGLATFHQQISKCNAEEILVKTYKNKKDLSFQQKSSILSILAYLTYYSVKPQPHQYIDFSSIVSKQLTDLKLLYESQFIFVSNFLTIMINVNYCKNHDFSIFVVQSDVCLIVLQKMNQTYSCPLHLKERGQELRINGLIMIKNIILGLKRTTSAVTMLKKMLTDFSLLAHHPGKVIQLLQIAMHDDNFWHQFMNAQQHEQITQGLNYIFDTIQLSGWEDCQNQMNQTQIQDFILLCRFMNSLYYQETQEEKICWDLVLRNLFNGIVLVNVFKYSINSENKIFLRQILKIYRNLSETEDVTAQQLLIVGPGDNPDIIFSMMNNKCILECEELVLSRFIFIKNLLKKDKSLLQKIMEFKPLQNIYQVLHRQKYNQEVKLATIDLLVYMVNSQTRIQRLLSVLQNKGIISAVENLSSHPCRRLYTKAELFLEKIKDNEYKHKLNECD